jgi:AGZA family xanthine/uracil permease-like MFS transporter
MKAGTGRWREINPCVLVVALLFVLKFVWVDSH